MLNFTQIKTNEALKLTREAEAEKAFLPSASEPNFSVEKFLTEGDKSGFLLFGSFKDNKLVGFLSVIPKEENSISIGPMYVSKDFRGEGLGKWQVEKLIEWAKNKKLKGVFTKTWGKNLASRKIFVDLGFSLVEERLNARVNGDSTVKYYLKI